MTHRQRANAWLCKIRRYLRSDLCSFTYGSMEVDLEKVLGAAQCNEQLSERGGLDAELEKDCIVALAISRNIAIPLRERALAIKCCFSPHLKEVLNGSSEVKVKDPP